MFEELIETTVSGCWVASCRHHDGLSNCKLPKITITAEADTKGVIHAVCAHMMPWLETAI